MVDIKPDITLDCSGLSCPSPYIITKKAVASMKVGQILLVQATDALTKVRIPTFLNGAGAELLAMYEDKDNFFYYMRRVT